MGGCAKADTADFAGFKHSLWGVLLFYPFVNKRKDDKSMKKIVSSVSVLALLLVCLLTTGCQATPEVTGIWADATYTVDTTLGEGATVLTVVVSAEDTAITLTINTDKETVGAALLEHNLIEGADGMYTVVNGMTADWNVDQTYWAFYVDGEYAMTGMDDTTITAGATYKLERTAG